MTAKNLHEDIANLLHDVWLADVHKAAEQEFVAPLADLYAAAPHLHKQIEAVELALMDAAIRLAESAFVIGLEVATNPLEMLCG